MPYAVVETIDALGNKELLAAPEHWIQRQEGGKQYLCWPNVRNINTLTALLQDESSVPSLMWEKHECTIKRSSICSLALASKTLEGIQKLTENKKIPEPGTPAKRPDTIRNHYNERENILDQETLDFDDGQEPKNKLPFDALGDSKMSPKVSKMFNQLKHQIDTNQEEMTKKMNEGFYRIQKTLVSLMHKQSESSRAPPMATFASSSRAPITASKRNDTLHLKPMKTVKEMEDLEKRLNDDGYRKQMLNWIDSVVSYERNPECRMMEILDLLFDRHLLPNFSWTGVSSKGVKKHAFGGYRNILQLFAYAGTTSLHRADKTFVANFFMKKLRHAPLRAVTLQGLRRCVPHSPSPRSTKIKPGAAASNNSSGPGKSTKFVKISRVDFGSLSRSDEYDESNSVPERFKIDSVRSLDDHQYGDYAVIEVEDEHDLQPTLFMSAEDEYE
ncbi:uncharacterized protein LOC126568208 [Anopheles maculipalpis]|uniref:uncharacterized protein LOC126568208 n=1 Tax=Anopheles maculipalpis TaxID=1496333 RepID=UPI0021595309|nr:uncharacterized protein LOC126568208 [Anopheles maculipalpis]